MKYRQKVSAATNLNGFVVLFFYLHIDSERWLAFLHPLGKVKLTQQSELKSMNRKQQQQHGNLLWFWHAVFLPLRFELFYSEFDFLNRKKTEHTHGDHMKHLVSESAMFLFLMNASEFVSFIMETRSCDVATAYTDERHWQTVESKYVQNTIDPFFINIEHICALNNNISIE